MIFEQACYTSCEHGLENVRGFQINCASPGIKNISFLRTLRTEGIGYSRPYSLPSDPSADELTLFPISLTYYQRQDGSTIISQAKYVGLDFDERPGNLFIHFLVGDRDIKIGKSVLPIEMWKASFWKDKAQESPDLPLLTIEVPKFRPYFSVYYVLETLTQDAKKQSLILGFLTAIHKNLSGEKRPLVIVGKDDEVAMWIYLASITFPSHLVKDMAFTTYSKDPDKAAKSLDLVISGTSEESDFQFSISNMQKAYYVFDFVGGRFSAVDEQEMTLFAHEAVTAFMQGNLTWKNDFDSFVASFDLSVMAKELDDLILVQKLNSDTLISPQQAVQVAGYILTSNLYTNEILLSKALKLLDTYKEKPGVDETVRHLPSLLNNVLLSPVNRNIIENFYAQWLMQRWLPNIKDRSSSETQLLLGQSLISLPVWKQHIVTFNEILYGETDVSGLLFLFKFAHQNSFLEQVQDDFAFQVSNLRITQLEEKDGQKLVANILANKSLNYLHKAVYHKIQEFHQNGVYASFLIQLFEDPIIRHGIIELAWKMDNPSLFALAYSLKARDGNKLEEISQLLSEIKKKNWVWSNKDYTSLFSSTWDSNISIEESHTLLKRFPEVCFGNEWLTQQVISQILVLPDLLEPNGKAATMLDSLSEGMSKHKTASQHIDKVIQLFADWESKLREKPLNGKLKHLKTTYSQIPQDNNSAQRYLVQAALKEITLSFNGKSNSAESILSTLYELHPDLLCKELPIFLFESERLLSPQLWLFIFKFLSDNSSFNAPLRQVLEGDMVSVYKKFKKEKQEKIDELIENNDSLQNEWEIWKKSLTLSGSLKKRLSRIFSRG